jgi:putative ABC transport system ATP-binding protein
MHIEQASRDTVNTERNIEPLIVVEGITKIYGAGSATVRALDNVSLRIAAGEFVAIMGASGSGKSTFMNILGCLDTPTSGFYALGSVNVAALNKNERAELRGKDIGFVFQGFNLLTRTSAVENVELPLLYLGVDAKSRRERAMRALKDVGLDGREHHTPGELSGGQQQRVAIARAIVANPKLILADEPTGNLDSARAMEIMTILRSLNEAQGQTVVMVTHEADIAACADRLVRFRDGKIVADDLTPH